jgi:uncharacterized protein YbaR (Trm112 family)
MFIELAELLECPTDHEPTYCVLTSDEMRGRRVVRGAVGCPICESEYRIVDGVAEFGPDPLLGRHSKADDLTKEEMPQPSDVAALLALEGPGGYVALLGSMARIAPSLSEAMPGIHFVGVNAPPDVHESDVLSLLQSEKSIPLRSSSVRGVAVGPEYSGETWLSDATRVLLQGLMLVVAAESSDVEGVRQLAVGRGLWLGQKDEGSR